MRTAAFVRQIVFTLEIKQKPLSLSLLVVHTSVTRRLRGANATVYQDDS